MNRDLFPSVPSTNVKINNNKIVKNLAGGNAYSLEDRDALTLFAMTGTFAGTAYSTPKDVLNNLKTLCDKVNDVEFISNLAIYSRNKGCMKDIPSFLLGWVFANDNENKYFSTTFENVVDNGKMLCNFWQIVRSNTFGRKNISSSKARKAIQKFFDTNTDKSIYTFSLENNNPSIGDVIKCARPVPNSESKSALFNLLIGKNTKFEMLDSYIKEIVDIKKDTSLPMPKAPFLSLSSLNLTDPQWKELALTCSWRSLRKNLNTFHRHNVFDTNVIVEKIAKRICDKQEVLKSKTMPYEIMNAYFAATGIPQSIKNALHIAMDYSLENTPEINSNLPISVCVDVSGSMKNHVMSNGKQVSAVRYVDIAALFASSMLKKNKNCDLYVFDTDLRSHTISPFDSILTNAEKIASYGGGGTDCAIPIKHILKNKKEYSVIIFISDNESWMDNNIHNTTEYQSYWNKYSKLYPNTKLICIDISPSNTTQVNKDKNVLKVSGFNDNVFSVIKVWLEEIK